MSGKSITPPASVVARARLSGSEWAWRPADFLDALDEAGRLGFRCIGGQFQFLFSDGTCEMYWENAEASSQYVGHSWAGYVARSNAEVREGFERIVRSTDFRREADGWKFIREKVVREGIDPLQYLVFVAYFENERGEHF